MSEKASFSLSELNGYVADAVKGNFPDTYWVRAETSDVRRNQNGHCYLELIEKDVHTQHIVAKARAMIWSNVYLMLSAYFEGETGQCFTSGINVLVCVLVEFHELYGYSLNIVDIDPIFTLGDIAKQRAQLLARLEEEGLLTMNSSLQLPELANRIAVISSPTAAGYEDFSHQLHSNSHGIIFYTHFFPAIMQGERSAASVIDALENIYEFCEYFDSVAIIRGGGATSDLSCFNSYDLAVNIAQFPLPVISGVGHERDISILDAVAHTRAKTPTAVADFLVEHNAAAFEEIVELEERLVEVSERIMQGEKAFLSDASRMIFNQANQIIQKNKFYINHLSQGIGYKFYRHIDKKEEHLNALQLRINHAIANTFKKETFILSQHDKNIELLSPQNILKKGYTLTLKDGKIVKSKSQLEKNDVIETLFIDGKIESTVKL